MSKSPAIWIMRPSGTEKRREFSKTLVGKAHRPDVQLLKLQLREMRESCLRDQGSLVEEFRNTTVRYADVEVQVALDAEEAVNSIRQIASGTDSIVINRSSTVVTELKSTLEKAGFKIIEPYYAESDSFRIQITGYWDLPRLLSKGLFGGFETTHAPIDLTFRHPHETLKDYVAVLGVSAASADNGSLFFLEHFANISKSLEQAKHVVLVVGLEKVVRNTHDAILQTECMGIFGMESILLNLGSREARSGDLASPPPSSGENHRKVLILLLDNGRSMIRQCPFRELLLCIGCKACVQRCPIHHSLSGNDPTWSPRDYLFMSVLHRHRSLDDCLHCEACRLECPLSIDIPHLMWLAQSQQKRAFRDRIMGNPERLAQVGSSLAPVSNLVANIEPGKTIVTSILGLDKERSLPRFKRESLRRGVSRRERAEQGPVATKKVAYYAGCFASYCDPDIASALVGILQRNGFEVLFPNQRCCGMPMMASKNMSGALKNLQYNVASLGSLAAKGYDIVTACPSCSLMIRQGYLRLSNSDEARLVSKHVYYIEDFLVRLKHRGEIDTRLAGIPESVFYHVPCHLRAQDTSQNTLDLLQLIPSLSVDRINDSCCGMAGYRGYKKAHSALSLDIGARLFSEIRLSQTTMVVTSCAACSMQIMAGTGIRAIHPVMVLGTAYGIKALRIGTRRDHKGYSEP